MENITKVLSISTNDTSEIIQKIISSEIKEMLGYSKYRYINIDSAKKSIEKNTYINRSSHLYSKRLLFSYDGTFDLNGCDLTNDITSFKDSIIVAKELLRLTKNERINFANDFLYLINHDIWSVNLYNFRGRGIAIFNYSKDRYSLGYRADRYLCLKNQKNDLKSLMVYYEIVEEKYGLLLLKEHERIQY